MTTYSISLDDVDLALLPARAGFNNFLRREHYQFQVLTREEDSLDVSHPCHICAIDVPAAFWSAHCAGAKHRANARIATAAAQRTSALITATPPPPLQPSGKFCDSCTVIAGKDHEKTKEHRISVIHDRMLCDLAKIYTGEDAEEIAKGDVANEQMKSDNKDIKLDKETSVAALNNNQDKTVKVLEENTIMKADLAKEDAVNNMLKTEPNADNNNQNNTEEEENFAQESNSKKVDKETYVDNETYIKLLNIPSFPKIQIQTSDNGILILINNENINVLSDNFHSYHRFESKIQCRACCCTINAAEEETHKLSMIHMKRIMQVVDDSHCIRKIYANWSHCILCNQVINNKNVNCHKLSMSHCDRKAVCTVPKVPTNVDVKVSKPTGSTAGTFEENKPNQNEPNGIQNGGAEAKNAEVETKDTGVVAKNAGVGAKATAVQNNNTGGPSNFKNAPNQNGQVYKSNNMTVYKSKEDSKIEYPYETTEHLSRVYCVLCKCEVPNKPSNRSGHLKGARHAFSMKKTQQ